VSTILLQLLEFKKTIHMNKKAYEVAKTIQRPKCSIPTFKKPYAKNMKAYHEILYYKVSIILVFHPPCDLLNWSYRTSESVSFCNCTVVEAKTKVMSYMTRILFTIMTMKRVDVDML
jgi:hypothetical protein